MYFFKEFLCFLCLSVISSVSFSTLTISSLKESITFMRSDFRSAFWFSCMFVYPGIVEFGELGSDDAKMYGLLLLIFLCLPLTISLPLVLAGLNVSVTSLSPVFLKCRSPGRLEGLGLVHLLGGLQTVRFSEVQASC